MHFELVDISKTHFSVGLNVYVDDFWDSLELQPLYEKYIKFLGLIPVFLDFLFLFF